VSERRRREEEGGRAPVARGGVKRVRDGGKRSEKALNWRDEGAGELRQHEEERERAEAARRGVRRDSGQRGQKE
jgi:hypothetical protein